MILRPTTSAEDWKEFLARPGLHWKPGRSAMETAYSWEAQEELPPQIAALFPGCELLFAVPEYKVPLPGGERDSQNDVFALLRDEQGLIPCMIEAKRDEPFGPALGEWRKDATHGRTERMTAICEVLGLDPAGLSTDLRYQLFHRAASAVLTAFRFHATRAAMVVQSFSPQHRWFEDFRAFATLFGLEIGRGELGHAVVPGGIALALGWASCRPETE